MFHPFLNNRKTKFQYKCGNERRVVNGVSDRCPICGDGVGTP